MEKLGVFDKAVYQVKLNKVKNQVVSDTFHHNFQAMFLSLLFRNPFDEQSYNKCRRLLIILKEISFNGAGFCSINLRLHYSLRTGRANTPEVLEPPFLELAHLNL